MWIFIFFFAIFRLVSSEMALKSYELEVGQAPSWMNETQQQAAIVDRWYVDKATAKCKPFKYLGSLGNFNNFVSKEICLYHLKFTPEEQSKACTQPKSEGICTVVKENRPERWYYSKNAPEDGNEAHTCHKFNYSGCGGNANNFETKQDCLNACQNSKNGDVTQKTDESKFANVPNAFDCLFSEEVDSHDPIMGVVLHKNKKKCVYAAISKNSKRGYFNDLPKCVETCITDKVAACSENTPYQVVPDEVITKEEGVKEYFYFNQGKKACLPFLSKPPDPKFIIDDGAHNIFSSVELCASFCPAVAHLGDINAEMACTQEMIGESATGDKYQLPRFYYAKSGDTPKTCKSFTFNGKNMNLNNFISLQDCKTICEKPLASATASAKLASGSTSSSSSSSSSSSGGELGAKNHVVVPQNGIPAVNVQGNLASPSSSVDAGTYAGKSNILPQK